MAPMRIHSDNTESDENDEDDEDEEDVEYGESEDEDADNFHDTLVAGGEETWKRTLNSTWR